MSKAIELADAYAVTGTLFATQREAAQEHADARRKIDTQGVV